MRLRFPLRDAQLTLARAALLFAVVLGSGYGSALAQTEDPDIFSKNDYGGVGLLQTRTARFAPDGEFEVGTSFINPYRRFYVTWQAFPWLEATFRYTDITNITGAGRVKQSQGQFFGQIAKFKSGAFLDRGLDLKFRLWREEGIRPALSLGFQDLLGTGLFSSEYLVASKGIGRFDLSMGLAWGYLGSRGALPNFYKVVGSRFDERSANVGKGGKVSFGNFFAGDRVGLFGGIEYFTHLPGLSLKLEYNGADAELDPLGAVLDEDLPIGLGLNYRPNALFELSLAFERGNALMFRTSIRTNFYGRGVPKSDPPAPELRIRPSSPLYPLRLTGQPEQSFGPVNKINNLYQAIEAMGFTILSYQQNALFARLRVGRKPESAPAENGNRALAEVLFDSLLNSVNSVEIQRFDEKGQPSLTFTRASLAALRQIDESFDLANTSGLLVNGIVIEKRELVVRFDGAVDLSAKQSDGLARFSLAASGLRDLRLYSENGIMLELDVLAFRARLQAQAVFAEMGDNIEVTAVDLEDDRLTFEANQWPATNGEASPTTPAIQTTLPDVSTVVFINSTDARNTSAVQSSAAAKIFRELSAFGFEASHIKIGDGAAEVVLVDVRFREVPRNLGYASRIAANHLPDNIEAITIVQSVDSTEISRITIYRIDLERAAVNMGGAAEIRAHADIGIPNTTALEGAPSYENPEPARAFSWSLAPQLLQHIGDPDTGLYLADLNARFGATYEISPGLSITGVGRRFIVGNLDQIERESNSVLPRVRSDIVSYLQEGRTSISRLQVDYVTDLGPEWYLRGSAGLLEEMFGGVGTEVLYRPHGEKWAVSADLNWVKQRDFDQLFDFRGYEVLTGHVRFYYDFDYYGLRSSVSAGRYLAGDYGVTFDVSREFKNGIRAGGFATFTDVSAKDFGEGSFDKGFYLRIPLDLMLTRSSREWTTVLFRPLTRDGGQQLAVGPRLFDLTDEGSWRSVRRDWSRILD